MIAPYCVSIRHACQEYMWRQSNREIHIFPTGQIIGHGKTRLNPILNFHLWLTSVLLSGLE
jgi:hypothetical protein